MKYQNFTGSDDLLFYPIKDNKETETKIYIDAIEDTD